MTKILILGGTGFTGKLVARHLLEQSDADVTIASRRRTKAQELVDDFGRRHSGRVSAVQADASDEASLRAAFPGHAIVVVASPTTAHVAKVARVALDLGLDYLDVQLGAQKFAHLKSLSEEIGRTGRCFITEAGFHPGLPSALVRFAAVHFDAMQSAVTAGYLGIGEPIPYTESVEELIQAFKDYQAQIYRDRAWTDPRKWLTRKIDFGGDIGCRTCYSMFFEELRGLPALYPTIEETGFFISESHWFTDMVVMPVAFLLLWLFPHATRTVGRLVWWGMMKFRKPPFRTELLVQAKGVHAGQPTEFEAAVSHRDAYELTAVPVVAALLQYLDGSGRKPGLWMMGHLVEPVRLMNDMKRMGVKLRMATR